MARKRMYNTVRTDLLESKIAHYLARRNYEAAEAIRSLARNLSVQAPIDEQRIQQLAEERRKYYEHDGAQHVYRSG